MSLGKCKERLVGLADPLFLGTLSGTRTRLLQKLDGDFNFSNYTQVWGVIFIVMFMTRNSPKALYNYSASFWTNNFSI